MTDRNSGENTDGRNPDGTFSEGNTGKPKGARNRATRAVQELLEEQTEALTQAVVNKALEGDTAALRLCLERICPALKATSPTIKLDIPAPDNLSDIARSFIAAAAKGEIAPDVAAQLVSAVTSVARVEEMENVKERLQALERAIKVQLQ
jgi:hypothetical protein